MDFLVKKNKGYFYKDNFLETMLCETFESANSAPPTSPKSLKLIIEKHSELLNLVHHLFKRVDDLMPDNMSVLLFNHNYILIENIKKGHVTKILEQLNINVGSSWSPRYGENPVNLSIKENKITICSDIICPCTRENKWILVTIPLSQSSIIGAMSILIPHKFYSDSLLELFLLIAEFMVLSKSNVESLEETEEYYGQMFGNLAHEIKNILTTIGGFVQLLHKVESDPSRLGYSSFILGELDRVNGILKNSIFYSSSKEQRVNICKIPDIIHEVISNLHSVIMKSNIVLDMDISQEVPPFTGDSTQFRQVFLNIIQNAIEAMPSGGTLSINCHIHNMQIHTHIRDTGIGMPPHVKNKIFQPFFSTKHGGTGLGLSVTKQVIEQYKGYLYVKSEKNKGTCFTIVLPIS